MSILEQARVRLNQLSQTSILVFVQNTRLIGSAWYVYFSKEAIFGKTSFKGRFRNEINGFRLRAYDVTISQSHTRWKICVVSSTVKQDTKSLFVPTISLDRNNNTTIFGSLFL